MYLYCHLSPSLSIYLYLSLHRPYSFDIPWAIWIPGRDTAKALARVCVPEQEQPLAAAAPLTAPVTLVHARGGMQPVHTVVPDRPDPDR